MSKKLLEMPPHGNSVYPWALWENGETYRVERGTHFNVSARSFRGGLQKRASDVGLRVETRVDGDAVVFRFSKRRSVKKKK